jgi:hypothetical protein
LRSVRSTGDVFPRSTRRSIGKGGGRQSHVLRGSERPRLVGMERQRQPRRDRNNVRDSKLRSRTLRRTAQPAILDTAAWMASSSLMSRDDHWLSAIRRLLPIRAKSAASRNDCSHRRLVRRPSASIARSDQQPEPIRPRCRPNGHLPTREWWSEDAS